VVIMSGYSEQVALERVQRDAISGFIQKPYDLETLRRALELAMEGEAPAIPAD
jgi:DNA-binding NarL/FixJ family response regulator